MIHLFHGFLGTPKDFSFLESDDVILHDIYTMKDFPKISPEDCLIGYSLGGRIALDIAEAIDYQIKKIILLNAHPGLEKEEERLARKNFEDEILHKLDSLESAIFMDYWNKLSLFQFDAPISLHDKTRFSKSAEIFRHYRLSKQKNHLPELLKHKEQVLWIIGTLDKKYMDLSKESLIPNGFKISYLEAGHRLFQHPVELKKILQAENIL